MARRRPSDALLPVRRQLRRARWRWNGRELARAGLRATALFAGLAAVVVLAALRAPPRGFGPILVIAAVLALVGLVAVARGMRRRWLGARRAPLRIDQDAGLRGRLATLAEVAAGRHDSPLLALLIEQNRERLALWSPHRTVPRVVPRGALATATSAFAALALALWVAPRLRPAEPDVVFRDEPVSLEAVTGLEDLPTRLLVAPVRTLPKTPRTSAGRRGRDGGVGLPGATRDASATSLDRLQDAIRSRLLGPARSPTLRDAGAATADVADGAGRERDAVGGEERAARVGWEPVERLAAGAPPRAGDGETRRGAPPAPRLLEPTRDADAGSGAGMGAGTDTDPNLLGPPTATGSDESEGFALALGAEVRVRRGAAPAAADGPPPPALDAHPPLARRQRAEAPVARMPLPPAYEPLVERLFAHAPR